MRLLIEKLVYGGDGLGRLPGEPQKQGDSSRGKAVFLPFVLSGETVEASLTDSKPGFARAHADLIVDASPHRIAPGCPYFLRCGGCHYQHASYEHQLHLKEEILRESLRRIAKLDWPGEIKKHPSPPWNYRNRSRLQVRTQPEFALGYFKFSSHELLPVEQCPISSPSINCAIAALWNLSRAGKLPLRVREIEFFASADDSKLLIELQCDSGAKRAGLRSWGDEFCAAVPQIAGISAVRKTPNTDQETFLTIGATQLTYKTRNSSFRVSIGSFFQTNRFLVDELVEIVTGNHRGELALDFYAGVGLFSTALACNFRHVVSVESSQTAGSDLAYNLPTNAEAVRCTASQYLDLASGLAGADAVDRPALPSGEKSMGRAGKGKLPQHSLETPDLIVVDPPRGGLEDRVARALADARAPRICYVSCDPATLARDLVPLQAAGYRVEEVHLVDLFPQTYHLESVVKLVR